MNLTLFPPESKWLPPKTYPDLSSAKILGIDVETKDPLLLERGPGSFRKDGFLAGISISTSDKSWYFPMRHMSGGNLSLEGTIKWLGDTFKTERTYIGANLQYEMEWLASEKLVMKGKFIDVQVVQALLNEEQESNALGVLCKQYLGQGKDETLLKQAAVDAGVDPKRELWKLHSKYVGPYAEFDSRCVLEIFKQQWAEIQKQDLEEIFTLESKVTPLLWLMRQQGVRVDLEAAAQISKRLLLEEDALRLEVKQKYGLHIDEWSGQQLARKCQELNIRYPTTDKGNPSFVGNWLDDQEHHFLQCVSKIRELNRLRQTFVEDWIFKNEVNGIIHPNWRQLASDEGGTRTGRLSANNPNPQQVPSRSDLAPLVRSCFIPMYEGQKWCKRDYSQQEPRLLVHFAVLCQMTDVDTMKCAYRDNPKMDFYQFLVDACGITRRESKDLTLGRLYGMGAYKLAMKLGTSIDVAKQKLAEFDRAIPFAKELSDLCSNKAQQRGWIKTLCGRRRHFDWWEPADAYERKKSGEDVTPLRLTAAQAVWKGKRLRRGYTHKALNSLIQGSAADMTKQCMVTSYETTGKIPYLQVHDELDDGVEDQKEAELLQEIANTCVKLQVPVRTDIHVGDHWK